MKGQSIYGYLYVTQGNMENDLKKINFEIKIRLIEKKIYKCNKNK